MPKSEILSSKSSFQTICYSSDVSEHGTGQRFVQRISCFELSSVSGMKSWWSRTFYIGINRLISLEVRDLGEYSLENAFLPFSRLVRQLEYRSQRMCSENGW